MHSSAPPSPKNESGLHYWRNLLKDKQNALKNDFFHHKNPRRLLRQHAQLVDNILKEIWLESAIDQEACLIAAGGYGRGELFPYSDVDLLVLTPEHPSENLNRKLEAIIGLLWDIGLAVGHSVRNLNECIDEVKKDITTQTNLLESRFLTGSRKLYQCFTKEMTSTMNAGAFFEAKLKEQEQRHKRFNDSAYNLEPNIKESPGGLRDLQNILWITRGIGLGDNWNDLVKHELISRSELNQIRKHEQHLQMLRIRLHFMANRREDRLIFDLQNELASELGFENNKRARASEQLMHGYYKCAKFIGLINEILLQLLKKIQARCLWLGQHSSPPTTWPLSVSTN